MNATPESAARAALLRAIQIEARNAGVYDSLAQLFQGYDDSVALLFREMSEEECQHGADLEQRHRERFGLIPSLAEEPKEVIEAPDLDDPEAMIFSSMRRRSRSAASKFGSAHDLVARGNDRLLKALYRVNVMTRTIPWKEIAGALVVLLMLVGLPLLLWYWRSVAVAHRYPAGTKLITLTAVADGGIWTQEEIIGLNYWRRKPVRADEIPLEQGDHVVLGLRSADVLHSFAIPILRLGPVDVPAGHTVEVEFNAEPTGVLTFLCWQVCSPEHANLRGRFVVKPGKAGETW